MAPSRITIRRRLPTLLVPFALLAAAPPAAAWEPVAPSSAPVAWVERDPGLPAGVFAATAGGLFHSSDAGDTWRSLDERSFARVVPSPADPSRVYAVEHEGAFELAVHRSDDGGDSFARLSTIAGGGLPPFGFNDLAVAACDPEVLYASASLQRLELLDPASFEVEVLRSTDGGHTWSSIRWFPAHSAEGARIVRDLEVAATDCRRLYAATHHFDPARAGLYRSDDAGETWSRVRSGSWSRLAVDPLDEDHVFAAVSPFGDESGDGAVWESRDGGASWARADAGLPGSNLRDLRFDPIDRMVLHALVVESESQLPSVVTSRDGGTSWSRVDEPLPAGLAGPLAVTATSPRNLLAVGDGGLERTALSLPLCPERPTALCLDDGRFLVEVAWKLPAGGRDPGLSDPSIAHDAHGELRMTIDNRPTALTLAALALLAVAPPAAAWEAVSPTTDPVAWVERDQALPTGVFAATGGGLFHSPDAGESWRLLDERTFERLATTPADPRTLYALVKEDTFVFAVYRSRDGGESFDRSILLGGGFGGRVFDLAAAPGDADLLYASLSTRQGELATSFRTDVQRSTDGGATWTSIRWFPADKADGGKFVFDLEVAPTDPGRLYAATEDGLDRSDDGGDTWVRVRPGGWLHLAIDPLDEDHVLAIAAGADGVAEGLWETRDGGAKWSPVFVSAIPEAPPLSTIHFDPIDRTVLYALAGDGGDAIDRVLASRDAGATWSAVDLPLASPIRQLAVTPTAPRNLLAIAGDRSLERTVFALPLCPGRPTALCLDDDRFLVEVAWEDFQGGRGAGFAAPLTADAGTFWFFEPDNVELAVKVLDARAVNGHWWVFFGALTNVEFDLRVLDLASGRGRTYSNPSGHFASRGDTAAFPQLVGPDGVPAAADGAAAAAMVVFPATATGLAGTCADDATTVCLLDRFRVTVEWQDRTGHGGAGQARPLTTETGWFWFFHPDNPELFVKVLDGRAVNGHWWVFFGSLTDVAFDLVVEDTVGGGEARYHHSQGTFASHGDTTALP